MNEFMSSSINTPNEEETMNDNMNQAPNQPSNRIKQWLHNKTVLYGASVVVIIVVAVLLAWMPWKHKASSHTSVNTKPPVVAVVEITPTGFVPGTLSVQPNTDIVWVNEDVDPHLPAADPYPTHTSMPSLVAPRALGQKETYSFKVTKAETIHYHDDVNPTEVGTIKVE